LIFCDTPQPGNIVVLITEDGEVASVKLVDFDGLQKVDAGGSTGSMGSGYTER
jgi:hypothetical protein